MGKQNNKYGKLLAYLDKRLGGHNGFGPEFQFDCPFCIDRVGDESSDKKLWVNVSKGMMTCYRCSYGSRNLTTFFKALNKGKLLAVEELLIKGRAETEVLSKGVGVAEHVLDVLYASNASVELVPVDLPDEFIPMYGDERKMRCRRGYTYLEQRGVPVECIERFKIGYAAFGRYARRLIFPVFQGGRVVYFTTRACGKSACKSLNPKNSEVYENNVLVKKTYDRNSCLLNYDNLVGKDSIVIVEGPFDMMAFDNACALLGKTISGLQIKLIEGLVSRGLREVTVALDGGAGKDADNIIMKLKDRIPIVTMLRMQGDEDPHDIRHEITNRMRERTEGLSIRERVRTRLNGRTVQLT